MDPGVMYIITYVIIFAIVAAIMFVAHINLGERPDEKKTSMKPIYGCFVGCGLMTKGVVLKLTVLADFHDKRSTYAQVAAV